MCETMKKKVFSRGIYIEGMRQLRVFGFIALSLYLVAFIAGPLFEYADYLQYNINTVHEIYPMAVDFETLLGPLMGLPVLVAPIMTLIVFSGFNKRKYSDFYHALPYTRLCIFLSFTAAILSWIFSILIIGGSISLLMHALLSQVYALSFAGWTDVLFNLIVMILMVVSGVLLGCSFTGTLLSNITVAGLVLFLPRLIIYLITSTISSKLPFIVEDHFLSIFSTRFNILVHYIGRVVLTASYRIPSLQDNVWCVIYSLLIAIVMGVLAAFFFIRRKSEIAAQSAPHRSVQACIRIAVTLIFSFIATCLLLNDGEISLAILLYILAVLAFFIYELLTTLKWKNLIRIIPTLGIVILLNLGLAGMVSGITSAATSFHPNEQDITSVRFVDTEDPQIWYTNASYWNENCSYAEESTQKISIKDPEIIATVANSLGENMNKFSHGIYNLTYYSNSYTINQTENTPVYVEKIVAIQTGTVTRYRRIIFKYEAIEKIIQRLADLPEYREAYMTLPPVLDGTENIMLYGDSVFADTTGDSWDMEQIFACLQEEINEVGFEAWYKALNFDPNANDWVGATISYTVQNKYLTKANIPIIRSLTPQTFDLLIQMHYESNLNTAEELIQILKGTFDRNSQYANLQIDYHYKDNEGKQFDNTFSISDAALLNQKSLRERVLKLTRELGEQLETTDTLPTSDSYIGIYYYYDPGYNRYYSNYCYLYLPLPESFNADGWNKLASDYNNGDMEGYESDLYDSSIVPTITDSES